jgi:hypothetical protein
MLYAHTETGSMILGHEPVSNRSSMKNYIDYLSFITPICRLAGHKLRYYQNLNSFTGTFWLQT